MTRQFPGLPGGIKEEQANGSALYLGNLSKFLAQRSIGLMMVIVASVVFQNPGRWNGTTVQLGNPSQILPPMVSN